MNIKKIEKISGNICNKYFNDEMKLDKHIHEKNEENNNSSCEICADEFPSKVSLKLHNNEQHLEHQEPQWNCNDCQYHRNKLESTWKTQGTNMV